MRFLRIAAFAALVFTSQAPAQGWIEPGRPTPQWGVVKLRTQVSVTVTGRIARVEVEEHFQNRGGAMGESDYHYPLPGEAVFSNFSLYQGDQELRGETMDAGRARAIYEEIVRSKRDPALIELAGHGLLRARVFPINPGETRRITLRYTQVLARAGDALQFRYAAGVPRPGVRDQVPLTFTLQTDAGQQFRDAFSPTHEVRNTRRDGRLVVQPRDQLSGDFSLFLPLANSEVGITVATHKPSSEAGYFMLTLSPGEARGAALPRDVTAVIDVSGSMSGVKMQQARSALTQLLSTLQPRDRFRLIAFSNDVRSFSGDWAPASTEQLSGARRWVDQLQAEGGTNISGALNEAFAAATPDDRLGLIIFLTDGLPSVGEQNPERIAQRAEQARGNRRVFVFGVGYDVNTYLLDRLSAAARGATQYVQPGENVEQAVARLSAKVQYPVLTDLRIDGGGVQLREIYPRQIPDLFHGEELVLFGRYETSHDVDGRITITGRRGGRNERFSTGANFPERENGNDFMPKLWASRKIAALTQDVKLNGAHPELINEIRELALRHGLLSEYTAYLVQEPTIVALDAQARVGPPSTPANATVGRGAVQQSQRVRQAQDARSEAQLAKQQASFEVAAERRSNLRTVAGRQFSEQDGVWQETNAPAQRVVQVKAFSPAYFALIAKLPELKAYVTAFERVQVAGGRVSVKVDRTGLEQMSEAELDRLMKEFRAARK